MQTLCKNKINLIAFINILFLISKIVIFSQTCFEETVTKWKVDTVIGFTKKWDDVKIGQFEGGKVEVGGGYSEDKGGYAYVVCEGFEW